MNLTKITLFACPIILAAWVLVSSPAEAGTRISQPQPDSVESTTNPHAISAAVGSPADRPLLSTGCSCARCTKAEALLQGQFPAF
jgi:hypothetical protein